MELVTFDLNGTLLQGSIFRYTARRLDNGHHVEETTRLHKDGQITKEQAYRRNHALFEGEDRDQIDETLSKAPWIDAIPEVVDELHDRGLKVWLVTDQPDWATRPLHEWGLSEGVFTRTRIDGPTIGGIEELVLAKWPALKARLEAKGIEPSTVCHVGDWENDVPVFENVGAGIGLNPAVREVEEAADTVVRADSLDRVLAEIDRFRAAEES